MRKATTLIELIFVIVIISFLSAGSFKAMQAILVREYKAKQQTNLSLESQIVVNQISNYLSQRIVYSTIGYDGNGNFEYIGDITDSNKHILEWIGRANDSYINGDYSGFIDLNKSDKSSKTIFSPKTNGSKINTTIQDEFHTTDNVYDKKLVNLIFSGSFDRSQSDSGDVHSSFGWHGSDSNDSFDIKINDNGNITITDSVQPKFIYEKYFLVDSAYAIARGQNIDKSASCITKLNLRSKDINNTLFLFSNYRPWEGETYCADKQGSSKDGNVSILMQNVDGFNFSEEDYTIRILLDINKTIRGSKNPVHFSKMKVVF